MKLPGPLTGSHPLTAWLNQLRDYVIANTPRPTVGMELVRSSTGFSYKPNVAASSATTPALTPKGPWDAGANYGQFDLILTFGEIFPTTGLDDIFCFWYWPDPGPAEPRDKPDIRALGVLSTGAFSNGWVLLNWTVFQPPATLATGTISGVDEFGAPKLFRFKNGFLRAIE